MTLHIRTPLLESRRLGNISGKSVALKMEALQPTGSFKIRGIGHACEAAAARGVRQFVSSSGGNAGLAVAYAGRRLGIPVQVVVPESAPAWMIERIEAEGATVSTHGSQWAQAHRHAQSLTGPDTVLIHPFDDPLLWAGHATMIDEVAGQGAHPDAIVLSVGGGGLLSGVAQGLLQNNWPDIPIVAVETEGTASLAASIRAGEHVQLERVSGIATSLAAPKVCAQAWQVTKTHRILPAVVQDDAVKKACRRFLDDHHVLVEPACGASLAVIYDRHSALEEFADILVIVCGGSVINAAQCLSW